MTVDISLDILIFTAIISWRISSVRRMEKFVLVLNDLIVVSNIMCNQCNSTVAKMF